MAEKLTFVPTLDPKVEELALVDRLRRNDQVAMNTIVSRHRDRLIRTATNLLRDSHEAEDISQEAFLKSFREIHKLRDDRAFSGYLYKICVRLCMDRLRSRKPTGEAVERGMGGTDRRVVNQILVQELLAHLPPEQAQTLVLREMEQMSYDEVADIMDIPVGTVRSRLHAAREKFRAIWLEATEEQAR